MITINGEVLQFRAIPVMFTESDLEAQIITNPVARNEIDLFEIMDDMPLVQGHRMGRYALTGGGYPFGYHHGCGHGRKPRTTR